LDWVWHKFAILQLIAVWGVGVEYHLPLFKPSLKTPPHRFRNILGFFLRHMRHRYQDDVIPILDGVNILLLEVNGNIEFSQPSDCSNYIKGVSPKAFYRLAEYPIHSTKLTIS
jgi:hypothetical protein